MPNKDAELILNYIEGDSDSLSLLISKYLKAIFNFELRILGDRQTAEDATQEVFIKVWKKIKTFRVESNFKTWLFTIARNTATDFLRKNKIVPFSDLTNEESNENFEDTLQDSVLLPDDLLIKLEDEEILKSAIKKLRLLYREVLFLHYVEDMTFEEIGKVLQKPLNTVKSYHQRAIIELRKTLLHQNS